MVMNKKGFEMIWSTAVYVILALVLMAGLIFIFMFYSGDFITGIKGYFLKSNVDSQIQNCNRLVMQGAAYEYCCSKMDIKLDPRNIRNMTCKELRNEDYGGSVLEMGCDIVCLNQTRK
jgi:hypothetical protein